MPTYGYICQDCGESFDVRVSMVAYSKGITPICTKCSSENAVRSFGVVSVHTGSRDGSTGACGPSGFT